MEEIKVIRINNLDVWEEKKFESENIEINSEGLSLQKEKLYIFKEEFPVNLKDMRDITIDECENIYVVDGIESGIYKYDKYFFKAEKIVACADTLPVETEFPTGIAIDKNTIYVADNPLESVPRVVAYSRINLQVKWIIYIKEDSEIKDIAINPDGNICVLGNRAVYVLNKGGEIVKILLPEIDFKNPTDMTISKSGQIYVLDAYVYFDEDEVKNKINELDENEIVEHCKFNIHIFEKETYKKIGISIPSENFSPSGLTLSIDNELFVGEKESLDGLKTIYKIVFNQDGKATLSPLWVYRDTTRRIINDQKGNIYVINGFGNKLSFLEYKEVIAKDESGNFKGTYTSKKIDSYKNGNQWHRFKIEGFFPERTKIQFFYCITDEDINKPTQWIEAIFKDAHLQGQEKREGLFLSHNKGRYLWFKIDLLGNIETSPVVKALNIYYPRQTYMDMLPAVYKEDPGSRDFLERFLSLFESLFYETDFSIAHISKYMDIFGAPEDFIDWLGKWLSMKFYNLLTEEQKRKLLSIAIKLYKMRGTREGIEKIVEIITGQKPFIIENLYTEKCPDIDEETLQWCKNQEEAIFSNYKENPFSFCVLLKENVSPEFLSVLKETIRDFSPAHTSGNVKVLEPWFYLNVHTYLGINTVLNKEKNFILEEAILGRDTRLKDIEECAQISRKARIGIDFKII